MLLNELYECYNLQIFLFYGIAKADSGRMFFDKCIIMAKLHVHATC